MNKTLLLPILMLTFAVNVVPSGNFSHAEDPEHEETYTCPMHPEVKTHAPGDCPICHMKLVPMKTAPDEKKPGKGQGKKVKFYRNPMNPSVTSPSPMKDSMGMDYIPVYESDDASQRGLPSGRGSFELSDEQAVNVKLNTIKVEKKPLRESLTVAARVSSPGTLALQVLEADIPKIKVGQSFEFRTLGSSFSYLGKVTGVDNALDPMTRTLRAAGSLSTPARGTSLRLEQSGVAILKVDLGEGLAVPEDAVLRGGRESLVYVVAGQKVLPRAVRLGAKVGDSYQILEGLSAGEEISSGPNFLLDSEARIRGFHD